MCPTLAGCYHSHIAPSVPLTSAIRPEVKVESPDNRRHPFSTSSDVTRFDVAKLRSSSVDLDERDWCCDIGEFVNAQYNYRRASDPVPGFQIFSLDAPQDTGLYEQLTITCWNGDRSEGRVVWGRTLAEEFGKEFLMRWIYIFTAFNEPLDLPTGLPE